MRNGMEELGEITQHLLRFSPDALLVVDGESRIRFANETLTQLFGYAAANLVGQRMDILLPERLRGSHQHHFTHYTLNPLAREMGARISDLFGRRADGSEFPAGIRLAPFRIGSRLFVAAAIRDMTERRRINEALVAAREEADRANRAKSRFLATASHDLRQPVQTIRLLNAAMMKVPRPELRDILQQQAQAIDSMIRLLNSLLDISRLEAGAITPELVPVDLEEILEELRAEFQALAQTRGLDLRILPVKAVLRTDRILFHQLLQNLAGNALKYTDRGHVSINCVLGNDMLTINVDDTGIGIPADKLDRIFDEYYQVDTHGSKRMGVGLGLAIVSEVAQLLKFNVTIAAGQGGGTRATVSIPRQFLTTAMPTLEPTIVAAAPVAEDRPRIVLVEDNDAVRVATELFLKFEGFEVVSAASTEDAERLFASVQPTDVVITDYHLDADNTGLDLIKALRHRQGALIPGIILTGDLPSLLRRSGTALPACRFLPKPVDTQALIHAINDLSSKARDAQTGQAKE